MGKRPAGAGRQAGRRSEKTERTVMPCPPASQARPPQPLQPRLRGTRLHTGATRHTMRARAGQMRGVWGLVVGERSLCCKNQVGCLLACVLRVTYRRLVHLGVGAAGAGRPPSVVRRDGCIQNLKGALRVGATRVRARVHQGVCEAAGGGRVAVHAPVIPHRGGAGGQAASGRAAMLQGHWAALGRVGGRQGV